MVKSVVLEAVIEIVDPTEITTKAREIMIETYGDQESQEASEVYSEVISVVKDLKAISGEETTNAAMVGAAIKLGAEILGHQIGNKVREVRIKNLDQSTYYNVIAPHEKPKHFGGAGARGSF